MQHTHAYTYPYCQQMPKAHERTQTKYTSTHPQCKQHTAMNIAQNYGRLVHTQHVLGWENIG